MPKKKIEAKYLFDLHAVIEALTCGNNLIRNAFISGLNSGEIKVPKTLSKELKDVDEDVYKDFQDVKSGRVYIDEGIKHHATQSALMDKYGTSIFGGSPRPSSFCAVAICAVEKLDLVTHARPLDDCKKIVKKCSIGKPKVLSLTDFAALA
ncbi:hypothetical protein [Pseudophaeobacter sp. C1-32P7]|uniref:hypothetical protein n=1 Tax=Pseudophaeobacter sp. C1-32P7 TaxID=3098142 RepID=UPI0034D6EC1E